MLDQLKAFLAAPFSPNMSAVQWALFYGLLLIIAAFWHFTIRAFTSIEG
jgi:hypothetical protein